MERGKEDFSGVIDGAGYKKSMDDPRKVPLTLVPPNFVDGVARVLQFGAKKYSRGNWMRGMSWSESLDAMKRHIAAIERGEDIDPDSGLAHIYHVGCGSAFLSFFMERPEYKTFDDRLYKERPVESEELVGGDGYAEMSVLGYSPESWNLQEGCDCEWCHAAREKC